MSERWFVVRARQTQETRAARELRNQAFTVYVPKTFRRERIGHRLIPVPKLRYVSYLFVMFDPIRIDEHGNKVHNPGAYGKIFSTRGVAQLFCDSADKPVPLHDREIRIIQAAEDEEFEAAVAKRDRHRHESRYEPGDIVEIRRGAGFGTKGPVISNLDGRVRFFAGGFIADVDERDVAMVRRNQPEPQMSQPARLAAATA